MAYISHSGSRYETNATEHWSTCPECGQETSRGEHWANCDQPDVCGTCGAEGVSMLYVNHSYTTAYNDTTHWNE